MDSFKEHLSHGLRNIAQFRGRDTKPQFVPYLVFCLLAVMVFSQVAVMARMPSIFTLGSSPESFNFDQMMRRSVVMGAGLGAVLVVLLAASIARRLRDTARSPWWGLLPLPFLSVAMFTMAQVGGRDDQLNLSYFFIAFAVTAVYLAMLAILLWLLTRPSQYPTPTSQPVSTHS